jgi:hypothetical protein
MFSTGRYQATKSLEPMTRSDFRRRVFNPIYRSTLGLICVSLVSIGTPFNVCAEALQPPANPCDGLRVVTAKNDGSGTPITLPDWGSDLTFAVTAPPKHGMLGGAAPNLTYTPTPGYVGSDSFSFTRSKAKASEPIEVKLLVVNPDDSSNIEDDAKKQLRDEWRQSAYVQNVLGVLQLLVTAPPPDKLDCKVLVKLAGSDPSVDPAHVCRNAQTRSERQDTYRAALGNPGDDNHHGEPEFNTGINFADDLAKANSLGLKAPLDEAQLFACTDSLIGTIYDPPAGLASTSQLPGRIAIQKIDELFKAGDTDAAVYQLLAAFPVNDPGYIQYLEDLRAAFEMDASALAAQVAKKTTGKKN